MADSVVTCPGCEKKYRIRDGSQTGSFVCTACGEQVVVGGGRGAPGVARPAKARKPARKQSAAARKARVQRTRPVSTRETGQKKQPVGLYLGLAGVVVVVLAVIVIIVMNTEPPPPPPVDVAEEDVQTPGIDPNKPRERPPALRETPEDEPGTEPGTEPEDEPGGGAPGMGTTEGENGT